MTNVTDADRSKAWQVLCALPISIPGYSPVTVQKAQDHLADALAEERAKARAPFLALAQELATVATDHHATVAGDAYADAADRIIAVLEGTYL